MEGAPLYARRDLRVPLFFADLEGGRKKERLYRDGARERVCRGGLNKPVCFEKRKGYCQSYSEEGYMSFSPAVEACRVPDELLAGAYEGTSAEHRSWIKTTLALVGATYPAQPSRFSMTSENTAAGFGFTRTREAAPWAVLLIGEGYASAVRLAAAIMPARLAGVEPIFAVWTGSPEAAPSGLFAALELTGVEQVFAMQNPEPLLRELSGRGRILRFGQTPLPASPYPVWSDRAPRIERAALPGPVVLWAHPDALPADGGADVVYAGQTAIGEVPLALGAGLEGCWLHTDLTPDVFMNERSELFTLKLEP